MKIVMVVVQSKRGGICYVFLYAGVTPLRTLCVPACAVRMRSVSVMLATANNSKELCCYKTVSVYDVFTRVSFTPRHNKVNWRRG